VTAVIVQCGEARREAVPAACGEETSLPVTTSYPGVYIEELPSSSHSVTPAPTSVTVFVGYTNPFWKLSNGSSPPFDQAQEIFSFADYEALYGGFFSSPYLPDYVGQAVFQFFENGGSDAFVVSISPGHYFNWGVSPPTDTTTVVTAATAQLGTGPNGYAFTALQPVGVAAQSTGIKMTITVSNVTQTTVANDTADLTITYGSSVETYRRVLKTDVVTAIGGKSRLVSVTANGNLASFAAASTDFATRPARPTPRRLPARSPSTSRSSRPSSPTTRRSTRCRFST
jgi:hypothetical protein